MKIRTHIPTRIPFGLLKDIQASLILYPPSFEYRFDNFIFILGKIFNIPRNNKKFENMRMVPIDSTIMKSEIGNQYKKYIDWLISHGFMVSNNKYRTSKNGKKGKCICYGYGTKYWKIKEFEFFNIRKRSLLKREVFWNSKKSDILKNDPMVHKMREIMDRVEVDRDGAVTELTKLLDSGDMTKENFQLQTDRLNKICEKDFYIKKDEYGRFHTNLTNVKKELRPYIQVNGHKMVGLDIKSCQPALLYSLLCQELDYFKSINSGTWYADKSIKEMFGDIRDDYAVNGNFYYGPKKWKVNIDLKIGEVSKNFELEYEKELKKYENILKTDIYDWVYDKFKEKYEIEVKSRTKIKKHLFSYIFGMSYKNSKMGKIWAEEFPVLDKVMRWIKSDNYRDLARILQKNESNIVINQLCNELIDKNINDFYTIHDSVFVPVEKLETTREIFEKILIKNNIITGISYSY